MIFSESGVPQIHELYKKRHIFNFVMAINLGVNHNFLRTNDQHMDPFLDPIEVI